jgi:hypothetical protein
MNAEAYAAIRPSSTTAAATTATTTVTTFSATTSATAVPSSLAPPPSSTVKVLETLDFAGETIVVEREISLDEKARRDARAEALALRAAEESAAEISKKRPASAISGGSGGGGGGGGGGSGGTKAKSLGGLLDKLSGKTKKMTTTEKSELDWRESFRVAALFVRVCRALTLRAQRNSARRKRRRTRILRRRRAATAISSGRRF